jgi:hypothetical protein
MSDRYKAYNYWQAEAGECPVDWCYSEEYEILVDTKQNIVVCFLGELEDRTFGRDLKPLINLLNQKEQS